jgi:hypothetical protein
MNGNQVKYVDVCGTCDTCHAFMHSLVNHLTVNIMRIVACFSNPEKKKTNTFFHHKNPICHQFVSTST